MIRSLILSLIIAPAIVAANAQANPATAAAPTAASRDYGFPSKTEIFRRIAVFEDLARKAASQHSDRQQLITIYRNLGILYEYAGMFPRSEAALKRAIELMKDGPQDQLAEEIHQLALLHAGMGNHRAQEKDEMRALAIRTKIGDLIGIALTWGDLADLYNQMRKYDKDLDYAERSYAVLANDSRVNVNDRIAIRQTLAYALSASHQCGKAIPAMMDAYDLAKSTYGADSLPAGTETFMLGFLYWHCGDNSDAADWMARGLKRMKVDLGWGEPIYLNAMAEYAVFLRKDGQREAASNAESEIRQVQSVVDARTLSTRNDAFLSQGH
jgi:tetratricopeptide (TPR) repeat protein